MSVSDRKYIIGLTGNIATGKTLVLRMLNELGAYTIDADDLAHILMRRGAPLYDRIVSEFGRYVLDQDGEIDRSRLGEIVFGVPRALAHLERITHPTIGAVTRRLIENAKADVVAIEAVKLLESDLAALCDTVWVVTATREAQLQRLMTRRRMTASQAMQRIDAQPPQTNRAAQADVVIDNSGDILATWQAVQRHFAAIPRRVAPAAVERAEVAPARTPTDWLKQLHVRRARRSDLSAMAATLASAVGDKPAPDEMQMLERFFSKGYFLAWASERSERSDRSEQLLGMVALHAENLIATVDDCVVRSAALWPTVGKALLEAVEADARQLSCEVAFLFTRPDVGALAMALFEKCGYRKQQPDEIEIRMWREVAEDYAGDGSQLLVKRLLERQVLKPI
jgi:dephospho-CoA kinase